MLVAERLGENTLLEKLGEGAFAEVWKAERPEAPGSFVAIKVATSPEGEKTLHEEWALMQRLSHLNIVQAIELVATSDPPYLVTEFVHGESLRARLIRERRIEPVAAVELLQQALAGLAAAHAKRVVHQDLKPENILIAEDGTVKITDFGLGRVVHDPEAIKRSMGAGSSDESPVGTYHYMAPEQMSGQPRDERSDIYACGVLLYEMLSGHPRPVPGPMEGVPAGVSRVVEKAMCVSPRKRYRSAAKMAAALAAALAAGDSSGGAAEGVSRVLRRWVTPIAVLAAVAMVAWYAMWYSPRRQAMATHKAWADMIQALTPGSGQEFYPPTAVKRLAVIDRDQVDDRLVALVQEWQEYYTESHWVGGMEPLQEKTGLLQGKLNEKYGEYGHRF